MKLEELVPGRLYWLSFGEVAAFAYIGGTGLAIFHPPGEPDTQSSFGVKAQHVLREVRYGQRIDETLSRRDQIAAMALQGLLMNPTVFNPPVFYEGDIPLPERISPGRLIPFSDAPKAEILEINFAALAVKHADALIAELDKKDEN